MIAMPRSDKSSRRAVLGSIAAAGLLGIAGCSSNQSPGTSTPTTGTTTEQPTTTTTTETTTTTQSPELMETTVLDNFERLADWEIAGGSLQPDSSQVYTGTQSAKLDRGEGPIHLTRDVDLNLNEENLSLAFRMEATGNVVVTVRLDAPDAENSLELTEMVRVESAGDWFRLDPGASGVNGLPELGNVQKIDIKIRGGSNESSFWIDDLRRAPSPDSGYALIFLDDGLTSAYEQAYPILSENAMPATVSLPTDFVGNDGYLTMGQLDELVADDWDIASHTASHTNLRNISRLTAEQEIVNAKQWLLDHGFETGARWLVYPSGAFSEAVTDFARQYHDLSFRYLSSRSTGSGPVTQEMTVSRGDARNIEAAKTMVDLGDLYNDIELFTFHEVGNGGDGLGVTKSQFREFVTYLRDSPLKVVTPEKIYEDFRATAPNDE